MARPASGRATFEDPHAFRPLPLSSYVRFDVIRRLLTTVFGCNIVMAMGITDVDDKIIARASEVSPTTGGCAPAAPLAPPVSPGPQAALTDRCVLREPDPEPPLHVGRVRVVLTCDLGASSHLPLMSVYLKVRESALPCCSLPGDRSSQGWTRAEQRPKTVSPMQARGRTGAFSFPCKLLAGSGAGSGAARM